MAFFLFLFFCSSTNWYCWI